MSGRPGRPDETGDEAAEAPPPSPRKEVGPDEVDRLEALCLETIREHRPGGELSADGRAALRAAVNEARRRQVEAQAKADLRLFADEGAG